MDEQTIAFIGGGNMAGSLVAGLVASGYPPDRLVVADPSPDQRHTIADRSGVATVADNLEAIAGASVVVLAVKPQILRAVVAETADALRAADALVVSIAAGIRERDIRRWLGGDPAIVRAMPNTPALLGCGATGLYANDAVSSDQRGAAESLLRSVGTVVWVNDESLMDAVTAVSGSGPAYFFLMMEAMERAAADIGLPADDARLLIQETALGAARMALESPDDVATLGRRVTSPGGTTEAAIGLMRERQLPEAVIDGIRRAHDRSIELAREFGDDSGAVRR